MSTAFKDIRRAMIREEPEILGRVVTITAAGAQNVTAAAALGYGTFSEQEFYNHWLIRGDSATAAGADVVRVVSAFAPSTGIVTHAGTAYTDQTGSGETVEITPIRPSLFGQAIQATLRDLRHTDVSTLPAISNRGTQWLHDLDWIARPSDIWKITRTGSPELGRNGYFEKFNTYSSGALQPDFWTLAGSGATIARSTTLFTNNFREGRKNGLSMTRSGTDCTLTQTVGLSWGDVASTSLQGETVTVYARILASAATSARLFIYDGSTTTYSDYHTGGGTVEELSKSIALGASATKLTFGVELKTDETIEIALCKLLYTTSVQDSDRYDNHQEQTIWWKGGDQSHTDLPVQLPPIGRLGQYRVYSQRPYPQFTQSRIDLYTAEADVTDAPLDTVRHGALAELFTILSGRNNEDTTRYQQLARKYMDEYERLRRDHIDFPQEDKLPMSNRRAFAAPARR